MSDHNQKSRHTEKKENLTDIESVGARRESTATFAKNLIDFSEDEFEEVVDDPESLPAADEETLEPMARSIIGASVEEATEVTSIAEQPALTASISAPEEESWEEEWEDDSSFSDPQEFPKNPGQLALEELLTLDAKIEAVVFASPNPMKASDIIEVLQDESLTQQTVESRLDALCREFENRGGGFKLEYLKGHGYQFRSVAAAAPIMERMFATRPRPISRAALETLAIIAYRQPVTRAQVERVRGVDAGSLFKNLLDRNLIACVGRKEEAGRPMLFGTTDEFLKVFRLDSLKDLPPLESFQIKKEVLDEALAKLDDAEAVDVEEFVGDNDKNTDPEMDFEPGDSLAAPGGGLDSGAEN